MNHFKVPYINPFKFVKSFCKPAIHFDDGWTADQVKSFEMRSRYYQKWNRADVTKLQVESSIKPEDILILNRYGVPVKQIMWTTVFTGINYGVHEVEINWDGLGDGLYFLYIRVNLLAIDWDLITEPIDLADNWPNTLLFTYKNSFNDFGVAWTTGIEMKFRCEAGLTDFTPLRNVNSHVNQVWDTKTLHGVASRSWKLQVGTALGVAPYIGDMMNRIFLCDYIDIEGKRYQPADGSKWEKNMPRGQQNMGLGIEIVEAFNNDSLEFSDSAELAKGIVTAYNIETAFFGGGSLVPITDVEEQG